MKLVKCPSKIEFYITSNKKKDGGFFQTPIAESGAGYDLVFCTLPYEAGFDGKAGAREGSDFIRRQAISFGAVDQNVDIDMRKSIKTGDMGDLVIDAAASVEEMNAGIKDGVATILSTGTTPFMMGGDDATVYGQIAAFSEKNNKKIAVVCFSGHVSDAVMTAADDGLLSAKNCIQLGVRDNMSPYVGKTGDMTILTSAEMDYMSYEEIADKVKAAAGDLPVMVLFNANFLDPVYMPGVSHPAVGGFSEYEAVVLMEKSLLGLNTRAFAFYGLMNRDDPDRMDRIYMSEILIKLYAVAAYNQADKN